MRQADFKICIVFQPSEFDFSNGDKKAKNDYKDKFYL